MGKKSKHEKQHKKQAAFYINVFHKMTKKDTCTFTNVVITCVRITELKNT